MLILAIKQAKSLLLILNMCFEVCQSFEHDTDQSNILIKSRVKIPISNHSVHFVDPVDGTCTNHVEVSIVHF